MSETHEEAGCQTHRKKHAVRNTGRNLLSEIQEKTHMKHRKKLAVRNTGRNMSETHEEAGCQTHRKKHAV